MKKKIIQLSILSIFLLGLFFTPALAQQSETDEICIHTGYTEDRLEKMYRTYTLEREHIYYISYKGLHPFLYSENEPGHIGIVFYDNSANTWMISDLENYGVPPTTAPFGSMLVDGAYITGAFYKFVQPGATPPRNFVILKDERVIPPGVNVAQVVDRYRDTAYNLHPRWLQYAVEYSPLGPPPGYEIGYHCSGYVNEIIEDIYGESMSDPYGLRTLLLRLLPEEDPNLLDWRADSFQTLLGAQTTPREIWTSIFTTPADYEECEDGCCGEGNTCTDTDDYDMSESSGDDLPEYINLAERGTVTGISNGEEYEHTDYCDGSALVEYYCAGNNFMENRYDCSGICSNGVLLGCAECDYYYAIYDKPWNPGDPLNPTMDGVYGIYDNRFISQRNHCAGDTFVEGVCSGYDDDVPYIRRINCLETVVHDWATRDEYGVCTDKRNTKPRCIGNCLQMADFESQPCKSKCPTGEGVVGVCINDCKLTVWPAIYPETVAEECPKLGNHWEETFDFPDWWDDWPGYNLPRGRTGTHAIAWSDDPSDTAQCSSVFRCVLNGQCHNINRTQQGFNSGGNDDTAVCGREENNWKDIDSEQDYCDSTDLVWTLAFSDDVGEYGSSSNGGNGTTECCGDDAREYFFEEIGLCISGDEIPRTGIHTAGLYHIAWADDLTDIANCPSNEYCVLNGQCHNTEETQQGFNSGGNDNTSICGSGGSDWRDVDGAQNHCESAGFVWTTANGADVGEYGSSNNGGNGTTECCGDDENEYYSSTLNACVYDEADAGENNIIPTPEPTPIPPPSTSYSDYFWRTGRWGSCTIDCGTQTVSRRIICEKKDDGSRPGDSYCDPETRPPNTKEIDCGECSIIESFVDRIQNLFQDPEPTPEPAPILESTTESEAEQELTSEPEVEAEPEETGIIPETETVPEPEPVPELAEEPTPAPTPTSYNDYFWRTGRWGSCTIDCGTETVSRKILCEKKSDGSRPDDSYCNPDTRPPNTKNIDCGECSRIKAFFTRIRNFFRGLW